MEQRAITFEERKALADYLKTERGFYKNFIATRDDIPADLEETFEQMILSDTIMLAKVQSVCIFEDLLEYLDAAYDAVHQDYLETGGDTLSRMEISVGAARDLAHRIYESKPE